MGYGPDLTPALDSPVRLARVPVMALTPELIAEHPSFETPILLRYHHDRTQLRTPVGGRAATPADVGDERTPLSSMTHVRTWAAVGETAQTTATSKRPCGDSLSH